MRSLNPLIVLGIGVSAFVVVGSAATASAHVGLAPDQLIRSNSDEDAEANSRQETKPSIQIAQLLEQSEAIEPVQNEGIAEESEIAPNAQLDPEIETEVIEEAEPEIEPETPVDLIEPEPEVTEPEIEPEAELEAAPEAIEPEEAIDPEIEPEPVDPADVDPADSVDPVDSIEPDEGVGPEEVIEPEVDILDPTPEEPIEAEPTPDPIPSEPPVQIDPFSPAPEYLYPDPNPLSLPTLPEEVEIIGTQPISIEQAIELGIRNNLELQQSRFELQRAQAELREARAELYPDVNVNANLAYQANEQPDTQQTFNQATMETEVEVDGTEFQDSTALSGTVELTYSIYTSGGRSARIQAAERQVRFQELQIEADTEELAFQIIQSYYDLQEADEQVQIFQASLDEAQRSLRDAQALERAGVGTRFDVLQAQVDVANALQNLRNQQSQQEIARRRLAERLNISQNVTLAAAEPVEVAGVWELTLEESIVEAFRNRAELQQQLVQREIAERNRRSALSQLGPQVGVSTSYGLSNTLSTSTDSPAEEVGFLSEFQAALTVGLRLFDGGEARAQARQAEANIAIAESQFANQRDQIRFDVEEAYSQLQSNFENIQTTALAVQQAAEALRLARLRFQAGVGTQTDVLRSQTELTQARFNNLQAILNYNRALASLQRSVSNLPAGYLNEVP
ncbi:MAG: hypothetical protein Kow00121_38630 [Elainellaceae cyanobacterium]